MKMMKVALLGGAALAVTSAGAFADDLSTLKSSMEDMSVVATPVADAPEGTTITWGGYVRQALTFSTVDVNVPGPDPSFDDGFDLAGGRARIWVDATTPTSIGDVDVHISFNHGQNQANGLNGVALNEYWGTWHMTPELSLSAGGMGNGADFGQSETYGNTVAANGSFITTDEQMRLSYASGPISFFVAVDDGSDVVHPVGSLDDMPDFHANFGWAGDMFSLGLGAMFQSNATASDSFQVAGSLKFNLSDSISMWLGGNVGDDPLGVSPLLGAVAGDYFTVFGGIKANVTEATYVELTGGYKSTDTHDRMNVNAGIYWNPVSQFKIGLQGDYTNEDLDGVAVSADQITGSLVAWFYF
jgi:hypothetical protein